MFLGGVGTRGTCTEVVPWSARMQLLFWKIFGITTEFHTNMIWW
jgi:hypothetical protein